MKLGLKLQVLPRKRLFQMLDRALNYPLTMVIAPMGYGKSATLRSYIDDREINYLWITASKASNMSETDLFWFLLVRGISKKNIQLAKRLEELRFPQNNIEVFRIIDMLEEIQTDESVVLVLDDLHFVNNTDIYNLLYQVAIAHIPWLKIVVLSRSYPPLPLEEMELKQTLYTIGHQELAFTKSETEEYFSLVSFTAPQEIKDQIFDISSGWISSIFLLATQYLVTGGLNDSSSINDMFESSLFSQYTEKERELLLQLALLDSFSIEMVDYIFNDTEMSKLLLTLYRSNAFIFHDQSRNYFFHQMFRDFLLSYRTAYSPYTGTFLERIAQWYSMNGKPEQAISYWMMIGNREKILDTLESLPPLEVVSLNLEQMVSVFGSHNKTERFLYPYAFLKNAFYHILTGNDAQGCDYLDAFDLYFSCNEHPRYSKNQLLGESAVLRTSFVFNDLDKMMEHIRTAQQLLGENTSLFRTKKSPFSHTSPHLTYGYYNKTGCFKHITDIFATDFDAHIRVTGGCGAGCDFLAQAEYALETGDFVKVEALAFQSINKAKPYEQHWVIIGAYLTLARLYYLQGSPYKIAEILSRLMLVKKSVSESAILYEIDNAVGYINGLLGQLDGIPKWLRDTELPSGRSMVTRLSFNLIVSGKALLLEQDYKTLEQKSYHFDHYFSRFSYQLGFIHNWVYRAIAKYHLYGIEIGCNELDAALHLAEADNIIAPFLENMEWLSPLLQAYVRIYPSNAFAAKLLEYGEGEKKAEKGEIDSELTQREIEIMECVRLGYRQKDIAQRLFISPNTVKRHLSNIYTKLSATNRTQAINAYHTIYPDKTVLKTSPEKRD